MNGGMTGARARFGEQLGGEAKVNTRMMLGAVALATVAGCSGPNAVMMNRHTFEGQYYRAKLSAEKDVRERFVVVVQDAAKGLAGAKEAGRYEATKYCAKNFGWSGVDWTVGPDMPDASLTISDGNLTLQGECKGWV